MPSYDADPFKYLRSRALGTMQRRGGKGWHDYDAFLPGDNGFLYDFSRADTLFQEITGQTVAGVEQNVGLALDISKWGGKTLAELIAAQPELVANGGFDSDTGWSKGTGWSISAGKAVGVNVPAAAPLKPSVSLAAVVGRAYRVAYEVTGLNSGWVSPIFGGVSGVVRSANGTFSEIIIATTTSPFTIQRRLADFTGSIDNISVKEIPGNHASQTTSGARPTRQIGGILRTDGSDDNLLSMLNPGAAMTLAFKAKITNPPSINTVIGSSNPLNANRGYAAFSSGRFSAGIGNNSPTSILGSATNWVTAGVPLVGVALWNGSICKLYENGVETYSSAQSGTIATDTPMRIGAMNNAGSATNFFPGDIYKALAINRALTPAEITKLTNAWNH